MTVLNENVDNEFNTTIKRLEKILESKFDKDQLKIMLPVFLSGMEFGVRTARLRLY